jgi:hypothetical protein
MRHLVQSDLVLHTKLLHSAKCLVLYTMSLQAQAPRTQERTLGGCEYCIFHDLVLHTKVPLSALIEAWCRIQGACSASPGHTRPRPGRMCVMRHLVPK